jgi:hypothetical protein
MKIQLANFKGQFLVLLGLTIPAVLLASTGTAQAELLAPTQAAEQKSPFIDASARQDSLQRLQSKPIGGVKNKKGIQFKEKNSSDKGKDQSDGGTGKEQCESGNCGGSLKKRGQEKINPVDIKQKLRNQGIKLHSQLPTELFSSEEPIM